jgi:uncharacterized protein YneF (UPF0154 family)
MVKKKIRKYKHEIKLIVTILVIILIVIGGVFFLKHKAKEKFFSDYNELNENYKKVLYATGKNDPQSTILMENFDESFKKFKQEYIHNPISDIKNIEAWQDSLQLISSKSKEAKDYIDNNNLSQAHLELEEIRNEWKRVFEREEISILGILMTDFHDKMEIAIELAKDKDLQELLKICSKLDESWKAVEDAKVDFSGEELKDYNLNIQNERENIDNFCNNLESENLDELSSKLKKDFISVYLKYG